MSKIVALLTTLALAACATARAPQAADPKPNLSSPPLTDAQVAPYKHVAKTDKAEAPAAKKPSIEQDGLTVKFNALGFSLTAPSADWKFATANGQDGSRYLVFIKGADSVIMLQPILDKDNDAKGRADHQRKLMQANQLKVGPLTETSGRWSFTVEGHGNGKTYAGAFTVTPVPKLADHYLDALCMTDGDPKPLRAACASLLDSITPL